MKSRKLLKRNYGKVYLTFNEPVRLTELEKVYGTADENMLDIAYELTRRINKTVTVTPNSLLFASLLSSTGKGFSGKKLKDFALFLRDFINARDVYLSDEVKSDEEIKSQATSLIKDMTEEGIIMPLKVDSPSGKEQEELDFYVINQESRPGISFYKNTIMHYLLPLAFTSTALTADSEKENISFNSIKETFLFLRDVFAYEFVYSESMKNTPEDMIHTALEFLQKKSCISMQGDSIRIKDENLQTLQDCAALIQDLIESYCIAGKSLASLEKPVLKKELEGQMKKQGITMYHLEEVFLTEALSVPNYNNTIKYLAAQKAVTMTPKGKRDVEVKITDLPRVEETRARLNTLKTAIHVTSIKSERLKNSSVLKKENRESLQDNVH